MIVRDLKLPRCRLVTLSACETGMVSFILTALIAAVGVQSPIKSGS